MYKITKYIKMNRELMLSNYVRATYNIDYCVMINIIR